MRIGAQHVHNSGAGQREHPVTPGWVGERRRGGLNHGAMVDEAVQTRHHVLGQVSLGMGDHRSISPTAQLPDGVVEAVAERPRCRLDQDPASCAAERHGPQFAVVQTRHRGGCDLAADQQPRVAASAADREGQLVEPALQVADADIMVMADVRRSADRLNPISLRLERHPDRVLEIGGAVVEPRQDVTVQVGGDCDHQMIVVPGTFARRTRSCVVLAGRGREPGRMAAHPFGHNLSVMSSAVEYNGRVEHVEALGPAARLLRDLHTSRDGLSSVEAQRRLLQFGRNELSRRGGVKWPGELARQLTHPLALLLWLAAGLSLAVGSQTVAIAVVLVILLNAAFAFVQELQAERAVEALAAYMPQRVTAVRDGRPQAIEAGGLVPGDIVMLEEGERVAADMRLLSGSVEVDLSTLNGESVPVLRAAELEDVSVPRLEARDLVFNGTTCTGGDARGVVFATGMHTELGRIAALSERVKEEPSPLERQVRRMAWLIAAIAIAMAIAFVPVAIIGAGLSLKNSVVFAVGLLAGNVPEGLLPVITLALAVAVRLLARQGALVKRLSAVETLGCTDVICTDKTGTLTENRMQPVEAWTPAGAVAIDTSTPAPGAESEARWRHWPRPPSPATTPAWSRARRTPATPPRSRCCWRRAHWADPADAQRRDQCRRHLYGFDPQRKLMTTLDELGDGRWLHTKGAPEAVLPASSTALIADGHEAELDAPLRAEIDDRVKRLRPARPPGPGPGPTPARRRLDASRSRPGRARAVLPRADHDVRSASGRSGQCHRPVPQRRYPHHRDHRRPPADGGRHRPPGGNRRRRSVRVVNAEDFDHRRQSEIEQTLADGRRGDLRACIAGGKASASRRRCRPRDTWSR